MDLIHRLRAWSYARQRLGDPAATAGQALRSVVAVYATHPTAPLALWARTRSFTAAGYRRLDRDRRAVRLPAMRHTIFLIPTRDARRIFTATRASPAHSFRPLRRLGVTERAYETAAARVLSAAGEPSSTRALADATGIRGPRLAAVLRGLRFEGRILTIVGDSLLSSPHGYVATAAWLREGLDAGDRAEALAWLAGAYLHAYGPARAEDFGWWSGATGRAAALAFEASDTIDVGGGLRLPVGDEAAFDRASRPRATVDLLPRWDAYTMGHAPDGRQRLVHPNVQDRVYSPVGVGLPGDGNPVVLVDGEVVGTWSFSREEGVLVRPFDAFGPRTSRRLTERVDAVARVLSSGAADVDIAERGEAGA